MKKLIKAFAVTAAIVGMSTGIAAADTTCSGSISNTGPGSTNTVTCVDNNNHQVTCSNNVVVSSSNNQDATSGGASVSGNTSGGNATSGSASNNNNVVVNVGASCSPLDGGAGGGGGGGFTVVDAPKVLGDATASGGQVAVKPVGGAGAGAGAAVNSDKTAATIGILGSAGLVGLGIALRKRSFNL